MSIADKKSSLVQIAQATLDEATQTVKVSFTVDGLPVDDTNPLPVVIDSQSITVDVALDKANDSVQVAGTDGTTVRVLSTNASGHVNIADGGNSITVDGTVSANQSGTWNINNVSGTVSLPTGASTSAKQDAIKASIDNLSLNLNTPQDILGVSISGSRNNQVEISFDSAPGATLITETFSGGGSVNITNGHSIYSTSTATTASCKVVTVNNVVYRPAHEIYSYFTAAFTAGVANSFQRIGIFNDNNGFFVGYENSVFGISKRTASVNTFVPRTSWNGDLLDGNSPSAFTRNGVAEAINLAYSNLFRIRFAWLGSASVVFEVFSPDNRWITFHTLKIPNSQYDPSIASPNLPLSLHIAKNSADATNLSIATACWAGGTTSEYVKISDTLNTNTLASLTRSVITGQTTGGGGGFVNVKVNPSGALTVDASGTVAATQSGTWNIASITNALPSGNNNIGDVDIASVPAPLNVVGQGAAASALRVQLADESLTALENISVTVTNSAVEITNDAGNPIPVSGTVTANLGTIGTAATASNQSTMITSLQLIDDIVTTDNTAIGTTKLAMVGGFDGTNAQYLSTNASGHVNIADGGNSITVDGTVAATQSGTWTVNTQNGIDWRARARLVYSTTNVTTGAWVQLISSVGATAIKEIEIFDSSAETLEIGIGTAGSEVAGSYIFPGGNGRIPLQIAANTRVAIRAVSATANQGEIIVNFYG